MKPCKSCPPPARSPRAHPPTRPSCIDCAEKHVGAAYVLLAETRDGYAHRLRAIGHLHEAEDESQAWPALHNAIRQARVQYQASGQMPDWQTLQDLILQTRGNPLASASETRVSSTR